MQISFCATVSNVSPVLILFQLPEASKPIKDSNLKLPGMDTIVALNERVSKVVNGEVLQLPQCTVIKVKIVRVTFKKINTCEITKLISCMFLALLRRHPYNCALSDLCLCCSCYKLFLLFCENTNYSF
jgi:hypothetical protein